MRDLKARNLSNTEIAKEVGTLLLEIKNSIALSPEETHTLCRGLRNLKDEWIAENAKKLSPEITLFILEKSFQGEGHIITKIFEALIIEPSNKENLAAWVHAFPLFKPEFLPRGSYNERLENREFINNQLGLRQNEWIRVSDELIKNGKLTGKILEDNLSQDDVKIFLRNFFGFEAYLEKHFDWALELTDQLNEENRLFLLNILCYARHTDSLVKVLHKSLPEDNLMQRIIELNPLENEDIFFKKFISDLFRNESKIPEILPKIKKHLFDNLAHDDRKEQLVSWLSQNVKIDIVENIPLDILEKFYDFSLFNLMQSATQIPEEEKRNSILRLLVYAMYWLNPRLDELINSKLDLCVVLLSFLPSKAQAYLISRALKEISENANSDLCQQKFASFMVEARKLPQEIWDQANKEASF